MSGFDEIIVIGEDKLSCSIAINLAIANENVTLCTNNVEQSKLFFNYYKTALSPKEVVLAHQLQWSNQYNLSRDHSLVIISKEYQESELVTLFTKMGENSILPKLIGVASDKYTLSQIQNWAKFPEKILGLNWVLPAHNTFFLEIIYNDAIEIKDIIYLEKHAKNQWQKDPYKIKGDWGIRSKMISAMIREAFYLVEHGYASLQDIDRACRNDAGTYLPFAGNFRYMDLMGSYAYGRVMKELNKELSTATTPPAFFETLVAEQKLGMKTGEGFYEYSANEIEEWDEKFLKFSTEIKDIMQRYPFETSAQSQLEPEKSKV